MVALVSRSWLPARNIPGRVFTPWWGWAWPGLRDPAAVVATRIPHWPCVMQHGYTVLHGVEWSHPFGSIGGKMHKMLNAKLWESIRMPFATVGWKRLRCECCEWRRCVGRKWVLGLDLGFSLDYDRAVLGEIMFCLLIDDDLFRGGFLGFCTVQEGQEDWKKCRKRSIVDCWWIMILINSMKILFS